MMRLRPGSYRADEGGAAPPPALTTPGTGRTIHAGVVMSGDPRSLAALIQHSTDSDPAFRIDGVSVSRAAFEQRVDEATAWLAAQGIGKGDVIAVWLVNRLEWMALLFAAARLGGIVA